MLFFISMLFLIICNTEKPEGKLNFKVDSLKYYAKSIDYAFGSLVDLYDRLQGKPADYDG
jgi:hypothetical protein